MEQTTRQLDRQHLWQLEQDRWFTDLYSEANPFRRIPWSGATNHIARAEAYDLTHPLVRLHVHVSDTMRQMDKPDPPAPEITNSDRRIAREIKGRVFARLHPQRAA